MKICIDAREFVQGRKTGISRYLETFLPPLLEKTGFEVTLFVSGSANIPEQLAKQQLNCVTLPSASTLYTDQVILPRLAEKHKTDIFFSPYYKIPLSGRFKRIITVHDIMFLRLPGGNLINKLLASLQLRLAALKADIILVDSEFTRKDLASYFPQAAAKSTVLYPTLDAEWLRPADHNAGAGARIKYAGNLKYFLYVGNFKPHKNVDMLVRTFLQLDAEGGINNHGLVLAGGDDGNVESIEQLAGAAIRRGIVRIHRNVKETDLRALYAGASWFISASAYEGFGYPMLEAMTSGCPVICSPVTSIPEIVNGAAMFMDVPVERSIAAAIRTAASASTEQRGIFARKGFATAETFLARNQPDGILNIFNKLGNQ